MAGQCPNSPRRGALLAAQGAHEGRAYNAFRALSWFLGTRRPTGMSDCHENGTPLPDEEGVGVVAQRSATPDPSLSKEGNYGAISMPSREPMDHVIRARGSL